MHLQPSVALSPGLQSSLVLQSLQLRGCKAEAQKVGSLPQADSD